MSQKESVPNRRYMDEFKAEVVRLATSIGRNPTAKRVGILESTVTNWVRRSKTDMPGETDATPVKRPVSELGAEKDAPAENHAGEALQLMRASADLEDTPEKDNVTPGTIIPAWELPAKCC